MSWTQPLCEACWDDRRPGHIPARSMGAVETCCLCGAATTSGIYIRMDPQTVPFPRNEEDAR